MKKDIHHCANCGTKIESGDFVTIIGQAPPSRLAVPIGRVDKLIGDIGEVYCAGCAADALDAALEAARETP